MATTEYTTASAERVLRWASRIWQQMPSEIYFGKFMAPSDNAIIEEKRDLDGGPGDRLTYTLARNLAGSGVTGDSTLEGSEEQLVTYSNTLTLDQQRNAIRLAGSLNEIRTAFDQRPVSRNMLKYWLARAIDDQIFTRLAASPTANRVVFGGTATSVATLTSTMLITPARIDVAKAKAQKADPKVWPVRVNGGDYYVLVVHTDCDYDLRQNGVWQGYQQNGAQVAGDSNPIFSGMLGLYNGIVVHVHEKVPAATDGGSGGDVAYATNLFLGKQAGLFAWGRKPKAWEKEFDYGNQFGMAIGAIWDFRKANFNSEDHGAIALQVARTNN